MRRGGGLSWRRVGLSRMLLCLAGACRIWKIDVKKHELQQEQT